MADYVVGRAVWLGGGGPSKLPKDWKPGRGTVTCPNCGYWVLEFQYTKPIKCPKCNVDCLGEKEWPTDDIIG